MTIRYLDDRVEVRDQEDGLDEVIAHGADLHLERMDEDSWSLIASWRDGRRLNVAIGARGGVIVEDTAHEIPCTGPSLPPPSLAIPDRMRAGVAALAEKLDEVAGSSREMADDLRAALAAPEAPPARERFLWSLDDEEGYEGDFPTREAALAAAIDAAQEKAEETGEGVRRAWTGILVPADARRHAGKHAEYLVDLVRDDLAEEGIDDPLDDVGHTDLALLEQLLGDVFVAWMVATRNDPGGLIEKASEHAIDVPAPPAEDA